MVKFIEESFTDPHEFLNALRLSKGNWWTYHSLTKQPDRDWQRAWIFRGECSVKKWTPLLPSAWRTPEPQTIGQIRQEITAHPSYQMEIQNHLQSRMFSRPLKPLTNDEQAQTRQRMEIVLLQAFSELLLVKEFSSLADEIGFKVSFLPDWTHKFSFISEYINLAFPPQRNQIDNEATPNKSTTDATGTIPIWMQPAIALAQHHGLSTRLLDWTRNALVAAYFAAAGADQSDADDQIVVYALHKVFLVQHIKTIHVPAWDNDYLRAQHGVFTLDTKADEFFLLNGYYPRFEDSMKTLPGIYRPEIHPRKLLLPVEHAPELMRLLWLERVTQAHMMPTLDNVASAVKTKLRLTGELRKKMLNE